MGIPVTMGFNVFSTDPIDKQRFLFNNLADMHAMPLTWRHPGMRCYVLDIAGGGVGKGYYELIGSANANPIHNDNWVKVEPAVVAVVNDRGNWDASSGAYPSEGGSGVDGEIQKGDFWYVSVPGIVHGVEYNVGDNIRSRVDAPGDVNEDWAAIEGNLGYVPENKAARRTTLVGADHFSYVTSLTVKEGLDEKANASHSHSIENISGLSDALTTKANDNAVVKLTGNQNVAGNKDFSGQLSFRYKRVPDITGNTTLNSSHINAMIYVTAAAIITIPDNILSEGSQIKFVRDTSGEVEFVAGGTTELRSASNRKRIAEQNGAVELIAKSATVVHIFGALKI